MFVDPLFASDGDELWSWADKRCAGREVVTLETIAWHRRSREQVIARYGATATPPASVVALPIPIADETLYWLPGPRALIPGDSLVGDASGGLSLCPEAWLESLTARPSRQRVRDALRVALLGLDAELVLCSHGEPVRSGGQAALARALA